MKNKNLIFSLILALCMIVPAICTAYSVMLPVQMPNQQLPYLAETDYYNGPACVQMALNSCPNLPGRHYHSQTDLYSRISAHNTESLWWFSDPSGMKGALMDTSLSPCGNWVDKSNTDKGIVLGNILYWIDRMKYLAPVSITSGEKWVVVYGYESDVQPISTSSTVNLLALYFYDPTPGAADPHGMVSGSTWESNAEYWGAPHNNPNSAWHNKYVAIIEPPSSGIIVKIPEWVHSGAILPVDTINSFFSKWLEHLKRNKLARGPFEILDRPHEIGTPFLVSAGTYKYYIVPFANNRLAAIFNAYNGSFEEFRSFRQPQNYILDPKTIRHNLENTLKNYQTRNIQIMNPQLAYRSELAETGRFSPTWRVQANVIDAKSKAHKLIIDLNAAGNVIKGLESISILAREYHKSHETL